MEKNISIRALKARLQSLDCMSVIYKYLSVKIFFHVDILILVKCIKNATFIFNFNDKYIISVSHVNDYKE